MKKIAIVLAIIASAAAQRRSAILELQNGTTTDIGSVKFTQNEPCSPIQIAGNITDLRPGIYYGFKIEISTDDWTRAELRDESDVDTFFLVFTVRITKTGRQIFRMASEWLTLTPNDQINTIMNRSIAIYDGRNYYRGPLLAHGFVVEAAVRDEEMTSSVDITARASSVPKIERCSPRNK